MGLSQIEHLRQEVNSNNKQPVSFCQVCLFEMEKDRQWEGILGAVMWTENASVLGFVNSGRNRISFKNSFQSSEPGKASGKKNGRWGKCGETTNGWEEENLLSEGRLAQSGERGTPRQVRTKPGHGNGSQTWGRELRVPATSQKDGHGENMPVIPVQGRQRQKIWKQKGQFCLEVDVIGWSWGV